MLNPFTNHNRNGRPNTNAEAQRSFYEPKSASDFGLDAIAHVLVVSDLHMSEGQLPGSAYWQRLENFTFDAEFAEFLRYKQGAVEPRFEALKRNQQKAETEEGLSPREQLLVINGDFIDFLRITRAPRTDEELEEWQMWLEDISPAHVRPEKKNATLKNFAAFSAHWKKYVTGGKWWHRWLLLLSPARRRVLREQRYGLGTEDFKSIYRLEVALQGHRQVFEALATWLKNGSALAFITGNHDPELDQELVQSWFRYKLEQLAGVKRGAFAQRVQFFPRGADLCERIRIEHGHRYEWHTRTVNGWRNEKTQEVALPSGSFFNRYFINKVETVVPYLDNVRPVTRVIAYMLRSHTLEALGMLGQGLRTVFMLLFKPRAWAFLGFGCLSLVNTLLTGASFLGWGFVLVLMGMDFWRINKALLVPAALFAVFAVWLWHRFAGKFSERLLRLRNGLRASALFFVALAFIALPLFDLARTLFVLLQTQRWVWPALLRPMLEITLLGWGLKFFARALRPHFDEEIVRANMTAHQTSSSHGEPRFAVCGHTHIPDIKTWEAENVVFLNSGTWTLVFEYESDIVRYDLTKTFVEFVRDENGKWRAELWRWEPPQTKEHKVVLMKPRKHEPQETAPARRRNRAAREHDNAHETLIRAHARRGKVASKAD